MHSQTMTEEHSDRDKHCYIKVTALSRYFGNIKAVDDVSFELHRGEILGFLGPNGAGKSTTMQLLTGNLAATRGEIQINGIDLLEQPRQAKSNIGYLPEQPPLYKEFTVEEYLRFCARLHRIDPSRLSSRVGSTLQRLELGPVQNRLIGNLSKGYQQRVGIAQAIIHQPPVIILDEPTVGLDPKQIRGVRDLIQELGKDHGVILSTHILSEVQAVCDRVQIINNGKLVLQEQVDRLENHLHSRSLIVGFDTKRQVSDFAAITSMDSIERLDDHRFRMRHQAHQSPAQQLVKLSVEKNWQLNQLTPEQQSLEQIFINLTVSEQKNLTAPDSPATEEIQ
ncbi:MAG: ABC transporter ATP-binding protein [Gammaproteobacteria bacterium]|nr:ABC transporter ATP-binding protein [Gammaproteobacteria bacterium]MDH5800319.1 ABC transporter ATP-binding protein [Gammaproteobacteria bacterium]